MCNMQRLFNKASERPKKGKFYLKVANRLMKNGYLISQECTDKWARIY